MNKKIIFTVTTDLNHDQRMQRICTSLQTNGYEVLLVGRKKRNSKILSSQSYEQKRINCLFESSFLFYLEYNIRLFFFLMFAKFDIVSVVDLDTVLSGLFVHKFRKKQIVYDAHEYFTELPELNDRSFVKNVWNWIGDYSLPQIKDAYTVNQSLAKIFKEKYNIDYTYIRSITKARDKSNGLKKTDKKIILYQGALNVGRGLEIAIMAMKDIKDVRLELAGAGNIKKDLMDLVVELDLEERVIFLGNLTPSELAIKTREAYIGLNLLSSGSLNYYYSLANKYFDYMHAGVPSINMDFPEYRLLNEQYEVSILLPELDKDILVNAMRKLLSDEEYYKELQSNSIVASEEFTWEKEEVKLLEVYDNL